MGNSNEICCIKITANINMFIYKSQSLANVETNNNNKSENENSSN